MKRLLSCCILFIAFTSLSQDDIPYKFLENKGQWPDEVLFRAELPTGKIYLEQHGIMYHFQDFSAMQKIHLGKAENAKPEDIKQHFMRSEFVGSNEIETMEKKNPSREYYNYFIGDNPDNWASEVRGYGEVRLQELYNGIDLLLYNDLWELKYDLIVEPGADASQIKVKYSNYEKIKLDRQGNLSITCPLGFIEERKPYAYQYVNGNKIEVPCEFVLEGDVMTYKLGEYNTSVELVIDPVLIFSTFCGSPSDNFGMTGTYDLQGNGISAGMVYGNQYPTPAPAYNTTSNFTGIAGNYGVTDVFISKYSPDGSTMIWSTYLGGGSDVGGTESAHSVICDSTGNVYIYGATSSDDFPMVNSYDNTFAGGPYKGFLYNGVYYLSSTGSNTVNCGTDIYVAKISSDGLNLMGSTYVGGTDNDGINYYPGSGTYNSVALYDSLTTNYGDQFRGEIYLDDNEDVYIGSCTFSSDFPTVNPFQGTLNGGLEGVVFKLSNDLSTLQYSSFLGGSGNDAVYSVKVSETFQLLAVGGTSSNDFPALPTAFQNSYGGGVADGFVARISASGNSLLTASYVGQAGYDQVFFVDIDRFHKVYFVGQTNGSFPVSPNTYNNPNSGQFVWKMDSTLSTLEVSTIFGNGSGNFNISPSAFKVDRCGNIYICGWGENILGSASLTGMPITSNAYQPNPANASDFYLMALERDFMSLLYGTYFGGPSSDEHVDGGTSRFSPDGVVFQSVCAGCGGNSDFPCTPNAWSCNNLSTNCNNGIFKFDMEIQPIANFTVDNYEGCAPMTVQFTNGSLNNTNFLWDFGNGDTTSTDPSPTYTFTDTGTFYVYLYIEDSICALWDTALQVITVDPELELSTITDTIVCDSSDLTLWASANGSNGNYYWSSDAQFSDTLNTNFGDSTLTINPLLPGYYYVQVQNLNCVTIDSVFVDLATNSISLTSPATICAGDQVTVTLTNNNPSDPIVSYDWYADSVIVSGDGTNEVIAAPNTDQFIYVTVTTQLGCVLTDSVLISVDNIAGNINAWADMDTIPLGNSVGIHVTPTGYSYSWSPSLLVDDPFLPNTEATPINVGQNMFIVEVTNGVCVRSDTIWIFTYEEICGDPDVFVPNAFTPNSDGNNDILRVRANNLTEVYFTVYNRWGEMMFETNDLSKGWDGFYNGKPMDPDVYVYYLNGLCISGQDYFMKGNVTLIR